MTGDQPSSRLGKFKAAAREPGVDDEDEESFTASVRRVTAHRPKKDAEPTLEEQ